MVAQERRQKIQAYLDLHGTAKVADLAEMLGVSVMTIHRDLAKLEAEQRIKKVHGGAIARTLTEIPYRERIVHHHAEKVAVAKRAAELVRRGQTIYLGPGTTVTELARALPKSGLEIITNSMPIAQELTTCSEHDIILTGGIVRRYAEALVGATAEAAFEHSFLHYAFIAVTGVDQTAGLTVYSESEARVLRAAMRAAKLTVLLTDSSKFDQVMGPVVAPLFSVHQLICDDAVPRSYRQFCAAQQIELITVPVAPAQAVAS
jgi:DeoR/GlpR family transcriptional regulator of sugar metabolism